MGTASEVTSRDIPPRIRALPSFPLDVLMLPGVTLWGEINKPTVVVDFDDFVEKYRGYMLNYETPVQIRQFFLGGGKKAIINRIVHINVSTGLPVSAAKAYKTVQTAAAAPSAGAVLGTAAAPFALVDGDTLIGKIDGNPGTETATINATAALVECANAENYGLADGNTLLVKIDQGPVQTITFNTSEFADIANATAEEVAAVINAELVGGWAQATTSGTKVTIYSDKKGTGSYVEVTGGTSNTALGFSTSEVQGTGNVLDVSAVTIAELKTIIEAAWTYASGCTVTDASGYIQIATNVPGPTGSIQVDASSSGDDELGLDNAVHTGGSGAAVDTLKVWGKYEGGTIGNALTFDITDATDGEAEHFDLITYLNGVKDKTHSNLTMDSTSLEHVAERLKHDKNESLLIDLEDLAAAGTALERRPVNGTGYALAGGDDGLALLDDNDFIGQEQFSTGIYAFDQIDEGDTMICPDRATTTVQNRISLWLETNRKRQACGIPDPPIGLDSDGATTHASSLTPSEQMQALPWPCIKIPNPDKDVYGNDTLITIKPSGSIAGRMAYNTVNYETHLATQPGNEIYGRLINVVDVETNEVRRIGIRRKITPLGVNPIMAEKDSAGRYGVWLNDVQAGKTDGNFKSIGENRMMAQIRKVVVKYLETIRTTPNTPDNRLKDKVIIEAYMMQWVARKALASESAEDSFYVNTDPAGKGINNALVQEREEYKVLMAVATARARRFVEVMFTRDQRAVETALLQQLVSP